MDTEFCGRSGKIRHATRDAAFRQLRVIQSGRARGRRDGIELKPPPNLGKLGVYRCPHCEDWHVGHRIGKRRRIEARED